MILFLRKLLAWTRPYAFRLALGILAGLLCGLMEPALMIAVKLAIDIVFPTSGVPNLFEQYPSLRQHFSWLANLAPATGQAIQSHRAIWIIAAIPLVMFLRGLIAYLNVYFLQWAAVRTITDIRCRLFEHLMSLDLAFFSRMSTGELFSRISSDIAALQTTITGSLSIAVRDPAILIGLLSLLLWREPKLTFISLLVFPLCLIPVVIYSRKVRKSSAAIQSQAAATSQIMHESFTGSRVIKAYNLEPTVARRFREASAKAVGHYMRVVRSMEIPGPLIEFFGAVGVALIFCYILLISKGPINAGDFFLFIGSIFSMYRPIKSLTRLHNQLEQARAATDRVFGMLETPSSVREPANPVPLHARNAEISFEHITFNYADKPVLHDFDLRVKAGSLVALVGRTGSGKTTVTNLLLRFYDPQSGSVRIGGTDIREVNTRDLREQIAVVTQETILFNDSIRNNIALGKAGSGDKEIMAAAKHAHASEFIAEKLGGYDFVIGEKGCLLSGGQRQRLAIARAILKNAPILVLDEATSSLDTESERAVQAALEELMQGRTTICIAHRLSTIQKADVIVVMDQGRIVEQGTHAELLAKGGLYQKLYQLQFQ